jgi:hypothetical protein
MSTNSSTRPSACPSANSATKRPSRQQSSRSVDRASTCTFTFSDGRQCRIPRRQGHPYLCVFHARKEAQALAGEQAGRDIASFLTGDYISACDVASALARLFSAVAQGHIKPKTAATLAYLGQTLVQTVKLAQHEYSNAFGPNAWRDAIRSSFAPPPPRPATPRPTPPSPARPPAHPPAPATPHSPNVSPTASKRSGESLDSSPPSPSPTNPITQPSPAQSATHPNPGTPISRLASPTPPPSSHRTPAQPSDKTTIPATPNTPQAPNPGSAPQPSRAPDRCEDDQCGITINGTRIVGRLREA